MCPRARTDSSSSSPMCRRGTTIKPSRLGPLIITTSSSMSSATKRSTPRVLWPTAQCAMAQERHSKAGVVVSPKTSDDPWGRSTFVIPRSLSPRPLVSHKRWKSPSRYRGFEKNNSRTIFDIATDRDQVSEPERCASEKVRNGNRLTPLGKRAAPVWASGCSARCNQVPSIS